MVASFYLPVILKKRTAGATSAGAGGESMGGAGFGTQGWTAEWDYEQLVALQVGWKNIGQFGRAFDQLGYNW